MSIYREHKTLQARVLAYAEAIGRTIVSLVSREDSERRRGSDPKVPPTDRVMNRSLFLDDVLDSKVREFIPRPWGQFRHLHTAI